MDPMLIILSKIISYEVSFVSQCMRRLTMSDGTGGPSSYVFPNSAELDARGFVARPPAHVPNKDGSQNY
jgi:hypothetical protein